MADKKNPWVDVYENLIISHDDVISLDGAIKIIPSVIEDLRRRGKLATQSDAAQQAKLLTNAFQKYFDENYDKSDHYKETLNSIFQGDRDVTNQLILAASKINENDRLRFSIAWFKDRLSQKYKRTPAIWIERMAVGLGRSFHDQVLVHLKNLHDVQDEKPIETAKGEKVKDDLKDHFEEMEKESKKAKEEIEKDVEDSKKEIEDETHGERKKQIDDQNGKIQAAVSKFRNPVEESRAIIDREKGKTKKAFIYMFDTPAEYDKYVDGVKFERDDPHLIWDRFVFKLDSAEFKIDLQQPAKFIAFSKNKKTVHYAIAFASDKGDIENTTELSWSKPYPLELSRKTMEIKTINGRAAGNGEALILPEDKSFILEAETSVPLQQIKSGIYGLRVQLKYNVTQEHGHGFPGYYEYGAPMPNERHPIFDLDKDKIIFSATYPEWIDNHVFDKNNFIIKNQGWQEIRVIVYDKRNPKEMAQDSVKLIIKGKLSPNAVGPYTPKTEAEISKEQHAFNKQIVEIASGMPKDIMLLQKYFQQEKNFGVSLGILEKKILDDLNHGTQWTSKEALMLIKAWLKGFDDEFGEIYKAKKKYIESVQKRKEFFTKKKFMQLRMLIYHKRRELSKEFDKLPVQKYLHGRVAFEAELDSLSRLLENNEKNHAAIVIHTNNLNTVIEQIQGLLKKLQSTLGVSESDPEKKIERECLNILRELYEKYKEITRVESILFEGDRTLSVELKKLEDSPGIKTIIAILAAKGILASDFEKEGWAEKVGRVL